MNCRKLALSKIARLKDVNILKELDSQPNCLPEVMKQLTLPQAARETYFTKLGIVILKRKQKSLPVWEPLLIYLGISHFPVREPGGSPWWGAPSCRESWSSRRGFGLGRVARGCGGRKLKKLLGTQWNRRVSTYLCSEELRADSDRGWVYLAFATRTGQHSVGEYVEWLWLLLSVIF